MPSYITNLNELTAPAANDYVLVSDTSDSLDKDKKMLLAKMALKNGTPTAGRVVSWTDANQVQEASYLAADVVRETGTQVAGNLARWSAANILDDSTIPVSDLSRLSVAQTFSALKTFNAGLTTGQGTNLTYFDAGVWPVAPTLGGSGSNPVVTYTSQDSYFMRFNNVCLFSFSIFINTISGGSGNNRIPMPFTASALNQPRCFVAIDGVAMPGSAPFVAAFNVITSSNLGSAIVLQNNAVFAALPVTLFGPGDSMQVSGFYYVQ